mmetsp:Transcript_3427/g.6767  ORF Transcript_3427/g.6767 Transcript_3427/m.6767 type:complete len:343 (-) Transcript_3427:72-1100(-)
MSSSMYLSATACRLRYPWMTDPSTSSSHTSVPIFNLLAVARRYSNFIHVVYSLLKGRPVIVMGPKSHRTSVMQVVRALSIFVLDGSHTPPPTSSGGGSSSQSCVLPVEGSAGWSSGIVEWTEEKLTSWHVSYARLVGVPVEVPLAYSVSEYSTVFDIDTGDVRGELYAKGTVVADIIAPGLDKSRLKQYAGVATAASQWPSSHAYEASIRARLQELLMEGEIQANIQASRLLEVGGEGEEGERGENRSRNGRTCDRRIQVDPPHSHILKQVQRHLPAGWGHDGSRLRQVGGSQRQQGTAPHHCVGERCDNGPRIWPIPPIFTLHERGRCDRDMAASLSRIRG